MRVQLDYGKTGLDVDLSAARHLVMVDPPASTPLDDPDASIRQALLNPIGTPSLPDLALGKRSACILICDITRPVPNERLLLPMLEMIESAGVPREGTTLLIATGLHRPSTPEEILEMLGERIAGLYRVENHFGKNRSDHAYLGQTPRDVPVWIDRRYLDAELKIATGLIEPHLMAGYSGGRKLICPGIAALETVRVWHSPRFLEHPRAGSGMVEDNPVHEENTLIAKMAGCDFIINVTIDGGRRITSVVAGDMELAWQQGVEHCRRQLGVTLPHAADIVITSSAGYPLDTTFYQSVKGMVGALPIVRKGGHIIVAASLTEGIGSEEFIHLLHETSSLDDFMQRIADPSYFVMDQWQLEELAKVHRHCRIKMVSQGLSASQLEEFFVEPVPSVEQALQESLKELGLDSLVAVVPKGPYVLASALER